MGCSRSWSGRHSIDVTGLGLHSLVLVLWVYLLALRINPKTHGFISVGGVARCFWRSYKTEESYSRIYAHLFIVVEHCADETPPINNRIMTQEIHKMEKAPCDTPPKDGLLLGRSHHLPIEQSNMRGLILNVLRILDVFLVCTTCLRPEGQSARLRQRLPGNASVVL